MKKRPPCPACGSTDIYLSDRDYMTGNRLRLVWECNTCWETFKTDENLVLESDLDDYGRDERPDLEVLM